MCSHLIVISKVLCLGLNRLHLFQGLVTTFEYHKCQRSCALGRIQYEEVCKPILLIFHHTYKGFGVFVERNKREVSVVAVCVCTSAHMHAYTRSHFGF